MPDERAGSQDPPATSNPGHLAAADRPGVSARKLRPRPIGAGEMLVAEHPRGVLIVAGHATAVADAGRLSALACAFRDAGLVVVPVEAPIPEVPDALDVEPGELATDPVARLTVAVTDWLNADPTLRALPLGYCALGGAVSSVLRAAAARPEYVRVIVVIGGDPAPATAVLHAIAAPTLLIVDGAQPKAIQRLRAIQQYFHISNALEQIDGAISDGCVLPISEEAFARSRDWLLAYLTPPRFLAPLKTW